MTLVEIYDKCSFKNLYASLVFKPERLIFLYDSKVSQAKKQQGEIKRFLQKYLPETELEALIDVTCDDIAAVKKTCFDLHSKYGNDLIFDLTGGRELMLFGALSFCNESDTPCYYMDFSGKKIVPVIACSYVKNTVFPKISIDMLLMMNGATISRSLRGSIDFSDKSQLKPLKNIIFLAKENQSKWGNLATFMQAACKNRLEDSEDERLRYQTKTSIQLSGKNINLDMSLYSKMSELNLVITHSLENGILDFEFYDKTIKSICKDKGGWLEYYTFYCSAKAGVFDEISMSAVIDWIERRDDSDDPINEIDLILIKDIDPVFISCKTGDINTSHLFEIRYLADKFAGYNSTAVIATSTAVNNRNILKRIKEMGIVLIDKKDIEEENLIERLKKVVRA